MQPNSAAALGTQRRLSCSSLHAGQHRTLGAQITSWVRAHGICAATRAERVRVRTHDDQVNSLTWAPPIFCQPRCGIEPGTELNLVRLKPRKIG
jgi:hypothetical protein